jgi:hypothetical protein
MKIIRQSATRLQLREHLLGVWLLGGLLALLGLFIFISSEPPVDGIGGACIAIANVMILLSPIETCCFDKNLNRVIFQQRHCFSQRSSSAAMDRIQDIRVEKFAIAGLRFYRVGLVLVCGRRLYLTQFPTTDRSIQQLLASQIQGFLQVHSTGGRASGP